MGFRGAQKTTPTDFAAPLCIFAAFFGYPAELATLILETNGSGVKAVDSS